MSGIKILPDELIGIVEEYADKIYLKKVDNIYDITKLYHTNNLTVLYSPTIIIVRFENIFDIFYNKKLKKQIRGLDMDTCAILNDNSIIAKDDIHNLETDEMIKVESATFHNMNEGFLNSFRSHSWSRSGDKSMFSMTTAKGNVWNIKDDILSYNNNIIMNLDYYELMCTINNDIAIARSVKFGDIVIYNYNKITKLNNEYYRFYGLDHVVDLNGDVFKFETLELKNSEN